MKFKCIGTGSKGNCYALTNSKGQVLLLDCGIRWKEIKRSLAYRIDNIVGCVVTHSHKDHSLSANDVESSGIVTWKPYEAFESYKCFGGFIVLPFAVPHDGVPCYGFFIKCDGQKLIYATDFEYIRNRFGKQHLNHMVIECNYTDDIVFLDEAKTRHVLGGHASLETVKRLVAANLTDDLADVILVHASEMLDTERCVREIQEITGSKVNVCAAYAGFETELNSKTQEGEL